MSVHWTKSNYKISMADDFPPGGHLPEKATTARGKRRIENGKKGIHKGKARLEKRIAEYERIKDKRGFIKPGSVKKS